MNRLAQQLAQNGHFTFNQKCRGLILQIFGHEGLFATDDLGNNTHCSVLNIDIYHIAKLEKKHLAYRKLLNPFKWLECLVVFPLEILTWSLHHGMCFINFKAQQKINVLNCFALLFTSLGFFILAMPMNLATHIALAIPKRILAPVRYIIRPTIEFAKKQLPLFAVTLGTALVITAILAASIFTGGIPLALTGLAFAGMILAKTAITVGMGIAVWASLLKLVTGAQELFRTIKRAIQAPSLEEQPVEKFLEHSSTTKITESLHAINPKLTLVNQPSEQGCAQTLALATGTEAIFYKPERIDFHDIPQNVERSSQNVCVR